MQLNRFAPQDVVNTCFLERRNETPIFEQTVLIVEWPNMERILVDGILFLDVPFGPATNVECKTVHPFSPRIHRLGMQFPRRIAA